MRQHVCGWIALAAALAFAPLQAQSTGGGVVSGPVVSVNVRGGTDANNYTSSKLKSIVDAQEGASGLVAVSNRAWNEADVNRGSVQLSDLTDNRGDSTPVSASVKVGSVWHFTEKNYATAREEKLGWMGMGYAESTDGDEITLSEIPYTRYDIILYLATDHENHKWSPVKVTGADESVAYYYYPEGATDEAATRSTIAPTETEPLAWGSTNDVGNDNLGTYGHDVMLIRGLSSPTLAIDIGTHDSNHADGTCSGLAGFQIVCTGDVLPNGGSSFNVNFASGRVNNTNKDCALVGETEYGLAPVPGEAWTNVYYNQRSDGTNTTTIALTGYGTDASASMTYNTFGVWSYEGISGINDLLVATTDDAGKQNASDERRCCWVNVENIPFGSYSVVLYLQADGGTGFKPVQVNGKYYTWQDGKTVEVADATDTHKFGNPSVSVPTLGENALLVSNLSGPLSIVLQRRDDQPGNCARSNLAGFQIICTEEAVAHTSPSVMSLNFASGADDSANVTSSSIASLSGNFGLVPAPADTWGDLTGNANETGQTVAVLHGQATVADWAGATVTWNSKKTRGYTTNQAAGAEPFLTTYLDDGAPGASVKVADVPFEAYDVIIYNATDAGKAFRPVSVNGAWYTWKETFGAVVTEDEADVYGPNESNGVSGLSTAKLGTNALRVNGLTGTLQVQGHDVTIVGDDTSPSTARAGIAAVQIVERTLITVSGEQSWVTLAAGVSAQDPVLIVFEAGASVTGDVTLPEDAIVDLSAYAFGGEGAVVPFAGTLTVNEGTTFRLPEGFTSGKIATAVEGNYGQTLIAGRPVWLTLTKETGTFSASYLWTDQTGNHLWSEPGNWLSLLVPDASSAVVFVSSAAHPEMVILDTAAVAGSVTIEGRGDDQGALTITTQDGGALTVSGRMLTTGNVAVTQSADITVNGKSVMVFPSDAPQTYPYPGAFHVEGENAAYTVASGTLAVPAKPTSMADPTDVEATACGYATVCGNATLTVGAESGATSACLSAFRVGMTWPPSNDVSREGTVRVLPTGTFEVAYQSTFASGVTLDLRGGTLRAKETATIKFLGGYAPTSPVTLAAEAGATLTLSGAFSGDAGITIAGSGGVRFATGAIAEAYTGEVAVSADATVALGAGRPGLSVAEGATVNVVPTTGETAIGRIVFPTTMESVPEGAVFSVERVTETVSAAVKNGTLVVSWPVAIPTLSASASWSQGSWTDWEGEGAPTSGAAILDGTGAPITVKLDTALSGMSTVVVRGGVTLVTSTAQASIPTCVTLAEGATLTVSSGFAGAWTLPEGTTLRVTDAKVSLTGLTLEGVVELAFSDAEYETMAAFGGGLVVSGDNVRVSGIPYIGDAETRLEGDNVTLAFSGTSFYTHTVLVSAGEGNALENVQNLNGELRVTAGTLTVEVLDGEQNVAPTFLGAVIGAEATLRFTGVGDGGQFPVTGEGTLDLGIFRKQLAARSDGPLPKTLRLVATAAEQEAGAIAFPVYGDATLPEGFVAEVTPAEGGIAWVPVCAVEGSYLRIRNVPGTGIAGLPTEVERRIRERVQAEGWTSAYGVEVRTQGKTFGADAPEVAGLLEGALECFDVEPGADIAASEEGEALTVFVAYEFGIEKVAVTEGGVVVTVRLDEATFKDGVSFTALNGETAIEGVSAAVAADRASVTLTIPSVSLTDTLRLSVKVSPPTSAE